MVKTIKKRIFGNNSGFRVKEDPNEWTESDVLHMARVLIRASKKHPIKMITFNGVNSHYRHDPSYKDSQAWSYHKSSNRTSHLPNEGKFMDFDVEFEMKCPRKSRKNNLEDIKMMLIMEVL